MFILFAFLVGFVPYFPAMFHVKIFLIFFATFHLKNFQLYEFWITYECKEMYIILGFPIGLVLVSDQPNHYQPNHQILLHFG